MGPDPLADTLKREITEIILRKDQRSARSHQINIGPSELSSPCDRQVGYRLAGIPAVNMGADPWAAIVGTAIHSWLEEALKDWISWKQLTTWSTERSVRLSEYVTGRCDWYRNGVVIDFKTGGKDRMREVKKDGPPENYKIQTQLYGLGYEQAGLPVTHVALIFLPRSGLLKDIFVWVEEYDRLRAQATLDRVPQIGRRLIELDVLNRPNAWNEVPATASRYCGYCSWYQSHRDSDRADDRGCPGR